MCAQFRIVAKVFVILVCCVLVKSAEYNNVCSRAYDYEIKDISKNCWYNADVVLSVKEIRTSTPSVNKPQIISRHGYPLETYEVTTKDGYKFQLFRIPYGKNSTRPENKILQPVLLQHGIYNSAAPWVVNGDKSIGFILADEGYDVWLTNSRGTQYGRGHVKLSLNDTRYWDFSFHEMAIYDTPKTLDLIYKVTRRTDIIMIGQSMGTTIQAAYASELPEHARRRVKFMVYLAPGIFLGAARSPLVKFLPLWPAFYKSARKLGVGETLPKEQFPFELLSKICLQNGMQLMTCELYQFIIFGADYDNLAPETFPLVLGHFPAGASLKSVDHMVQLMMTNKFAKYDYGPWLNLQYYNTFKPPNYQLSNVEISGLIIYGNNDFIATKKGAIQMYKELPKINEIFEINDKSYNHLDFFFARTVVEEIVNPMFKVINNYKVTL